MDFNIQGATIQRRSAVRRFSSSQRIGRREPAG
jgi:hypothetical protein